MAFKMRGLTFGRVVLVLGLALGAVVAPGVNRTRAAGEAAPAAVGPALSYPIMFVTQLPVAADFTTIGSTFGNHLASLSSAGRGGDLWIRYPDGTLKNLTQAAGYG